MQELNKLSLCALLWILLFTSCTHSDWSEHRSTPGAPIGHPEQSIDWQTDGLPMTNLDSKSTARPVRALIDQWCAAYGDLNEKELAALESPDIEIVDRFGELHVAKQRSDEERFWAQGFEMIRREDFHPMCAIEEIRSTRPDVVIVHADISYSDGIPLKGGDFVPAFSEIHTFIVSRDDAGWRIAGHDITKRALQ